MTPAEIAQTYKLRRAGNKWIGPCPKCGGSDRSDKFNLRDDGGFKCYACDFRGDAISWHRQMEDMSCPDAHEAIGRACHKSSCPVWDKCRLGRRSEGVVPRVAELKPRSSPRAAEISRKNSEEVVGSWLEYFGPFVDKAAAALEQNEEQLSYLRSRGIDQIRGPGYCLGWADHPRMPKRIRLGLSPERNNKDYLWIPEGLIIAVYDQSGSLHRVRVRRTEEARAKFLPDLKYVWMEGSGSDPIVMGSPDPARGAQVHEAELDAIACCLAHPGIYSISLGTAQTPLSDQVLSICRSAPVVLVSLDADGQTRAGQSAAKRWIDAFPHARYWPAPRGSDAGDYHQQGGDLFKWIEAGLPPVVSDPATAVDHEQTAPSLIDQVGEEGGMDYYRGQSQEGTDFVVAASRSDIDELYDRYGCAVFAPTEINHLKALPRAAAELALKVKSIFNNGEILYVRKAGER